MKYKQFMGLICQGDFMLVYQLKDSRIAGPVRLLFEQNDRFFDTHNLLYILGNLTLFLKKHVVLML